MGEVIKFTTLKIGEVYPNPVPSSGPRLDIEDGTFVITIGLENLQEIEIESFQKGVQKLFFFAKEQYVPVLLTFEFCDTFDLVEVNFNAKNADPAEIAALLKTKASIRFCLISDGILHAYINYSLPVEAWDLIEAGINRQILSSYNCKDYDRDLSEIYKIAIDEITAQGIGF